jgi:hypothetical protein
VGHLPAARGQAAHDPLQRDPRLYRLPGGTPARAEARGWPTFAVGQQ